VTEGENARGETLEGLAAERTLSVTTHCLRQQQTRLLGNAGCFVSIACLLLGTLSIPFPYTLLFCLFSHTHITLHYPFAVLFFSSLLLVTGFSICSLHCTALRSPSSSSRGSNFRAPRHSLRFAYTPYLLVPPTVLGPAARNVARIPSAPFYIHYSYHSPQHLRAGE